MDYKVVKNISDHMEKQDRMINGIWPEFMLHDPIAMQNWWCLFEYFSPFQLSLESAGDFIGIANSIPLTFTGHVNDLPEDGWDWAFKKGIKDHKNNLKPNILCGLQIVVNRDQMGKGLSSSILHELITTAGYHGLKKLIIPVRPSLKSKYPLMDIDSYIQWRREDQLPFDPWLRVHIRAGGKIIKACHSAMRISGTFNEWREWSGLEFPFSGDYIVPGALNPVTANKEDNLITYVEPNVWVLHNI